MTEIFIGLLDDPVMGMWFLFSGFFFFAAFFTLRVWWDVKGIRGLAMVVLTVSCGLLAMLMGVARSPDARIPWPLILYSLRPLFGFMLASVLIIVDAYAADHNDHRSAVTIFYQWFKRMTYERPRKGDGRSEIHHAGGKP